MRILGLDLGERWIGVAAADSAMPVAVPLITIAVDGDAVEAIIRLARDERAGQLIVGLPLTLSGEVGPQARRIMTQVEALEERAPIPVVTWDERLTTVEAGHRAKASATRSRTRRKSHADRARQDAIAAAIMLQSYLDSVRL